jgi:hypothetical protein
MCIRDSVKGDLRSKPLAGMDTSENMKRVRWEAKINRDEIDNLLLMLEMVCIFIV